MVCYCPEMRVILCRDPVDRAKRSDGAAHGLRDNPHMGARQTRAMTVQLVGPITLARSCVKNGRIRSAAWAGNAICACLCRISKPRCVSRLEPRRLVDAIQPACSACVEVKIRAEIGKNTARPASCRPVLCPCRPNLCKQGDHFAGCVP